MATFWATFGNIWTILVPTSGHTVHNACYYRLRAHLKPQSIKEPIYQTVRICQVGTHTIIPSLGRAKKLRTRVRMHPSEAFIEHYLPLTVFTKYENKEKEAGNGSFKKVISRLKP